jgi:fructose-bisphosphate aldolase class II
MERTEMMALVSLRQLLDHGAENDYGMPAFNINNMEQMLAIMSAAEKTDSPVIMQASRGARKYANDIVLRHLIIAAAEMYPEIPICMHQDHGNNAATCMSAVASGFSSVMMDGSLEEDGKTPASYEYNANTTADVTRMSHLVGVSVEGELGCLGSLETGEGDKEDGHGFEGKLDKGMLLTDPDEAADFVKKTKVDALAIAMGTSHGAYKFTRKPTGDILAMSVVKAIHERLPDTHLVMHGSSSVPQDLQDIINANGGEMPQTYGVPVEEIEIGIKNGVRKINIDTDNRMAITGQIRKILNENPTEFDPRAYLKPAMSAMETVCIDRFERFNCAGQASKIKAIPLHDMAARYANGSLDPTIK